MATDPTLIIETPLMIVPPAALTKASRGRKQVLSGVQNIVNALDEIAEKTSCLPQERVATVDKLLKDLANLKELELVDLQIFEEAAAVLEGVRRRDTAPGLQWCRANQRSLSKIKSSLEFRWRLQEFVELVRRGERDEAIAHARTHLVAWGKEHIEDIKRAFTMLLFGPGTSLKRYKDLLEPGRWDELAAMFMNDLLKLNNMTARSLLDIHLRAGLMSLKVPESLEERIREDPMNLPTFQRLAEGLPFAKYEHSKFVCAISGEIMDENNYPVITPSGYVYSVEAAADVADKNEGKFICPMTGEECNFDELVHAFIS